MAEESVASKTARTAFWGAVQQFSGMGISFVITMVLARLLSPSDYGSVALLGVFFAVANSISECGFRNALIRKDNCTQADYSTSFFYNVAVSIALYIVLFFCAPFIADFYDTPILCPVMRVSGISMIIGAICITQQVQLTRRLDFKKPALVSMFTGIASGSVGIVAAYFGLGVWALVIQGLFSGALGAIVLISIVRWRPTFEFSNDSFRYLWGFGSKMLVTGMISTVYSNIYSIVIGKFYSAGALGLFNRGSRSAGLFPSIIGSMFTGNTLPILSQIKNDHERLVSVYRKYVILTSFLNIPCCLLLAALAKPYVIFLLSDKWAGAIIYLQIFCLAKMLDPAGIINLNIFQVEGRSDITLKLEVIKKCVGFMTVFALARFSPLVLAIGSSLYMLFAYSINLYYVNKLERIPYTQQLRDLAPCLIAGFIAAGCAYLFTLLPIISFAQLCMGGIVGLTVYFAITRYIFRMEVYVQLYGYARQTIKRYRG